MQICLVCLHKPFQKENPTKMLSKNIKMFLCEITIALVSTIMYIALCLPYILLDLKEFNSFLLVLTKALFQAMTFFFHINCSNKRSIINFKFILGAVSNFHASRLMRPAFFRGCAFHLIPRLVNTVSFFFIIFLLLFPCTSAPLRRLETPSSCES